MSRGTLRSEVLRGGAYLTARQALGTAINIVGVVLLTRIIGPGAFGVYAAAMGAFLALQLLAQMGISVFLIRREDLTPSRLQVFSGVASTLIVVLAGAAGVVGVATLPLLQGWTRIEGITGVALVMYATLPVANLVQVPLARLERELDYRRVAWIELTGQLVFLSVALSLAAAGWRWWSPTLGFVAQQIALVGLTHAATREAPRLRWDPIIAREILAYGVGFTGSMWLYQLRRLVNPLIVGRYLGAEAVGVVALTVQIVMHLSFVAVATWRLSTAALARVQQSRDRLHRAVSDGMRLQTLAVGPFLVLFAWLAPVAVPLLLGQAWDGISVVYPWIAVAVLANSVFNLQCSALYVLRKNGQMAVFHALQTALLAAAAALLVPRLGIIGYGVAEVAAIGSYGLLHAFTRRAIGSPAYARTLAIAAAVAVAVAVEHLGIWSLAGLAVVAIALQPWREVSGVVADLRATVDG